MNTKPIQFKLDQYSNWFNIPYNMSYEEGWEQAIEDVKNRHEQSNAIRSNTSKDIKMTTMMLGEWHLTVMEAMTMGAIGITNDDIGSERSHTI